jgi:predicted membrane protein
MSQQGREGPETGASPPSIRLTPHLMFGLLICLVGVVFTLDNLNIAEARDYLKYWPAGLIAIGVAKLWQVREGHGSAIGGVLFIMAGAWMLLDTFELIAVSFLDFWPLLLIMVGGMIIWQGVRGRHHLAGGAGDATVNAIAVLSGVNRGSNSPAFRGGELTAFMGGCEIDLRQAAIHGEAIIDVFAMWGGIEIRVPENWSVIGRVTPLMGGFDDATRAPQGVTAHKLIVRGVVLMGGVEVKN